MNNDIKNYKYKSIVFIGPNGKETWIGEIKGLKDMYPKAKIIKIGKV